MNDEEMYNTEMEEGQEQAAYEDAQSVEGPQDELEGTEPELQKATVIVKKDEDTILEYEIDTLPVRIGRKNDNEIVLEEKNVSRKHAQIIMKEDQYFIEDLGSTGGTKLDGENVTEKDIHTGDIIEIGQYRLHFNSGFPEDERTVIETEEETVLEEGTVVDEDRTKFYEEPEAKLVVVKSEALEGEFVLESEEITIGRDEEVDISVDDKRLSRKHCKVMLDGGHFIISDLDSSNGTFVNGQKITEKVLEDRDRIQVGSNVFEFRTLQAVAPEKRGILKTLTKALLSIILLAVVAFIGYRVILNLGAGKSQKVIMQKLWEHSTREAVVASPGLGDLNGDGYTNMVAADLSGTIYALDGRQGGLIWNSAFQSGGGAIHASPLLVDINEQDGELDVVVCTRTKGVLTIDGGRMRPIWTGRLGSAVTSSAAAADINADGIEDIFVGTEAGSVYCFDGRQGGTVWKFDAGAPINASPVLADLNGDRISDVIVGAINGKMYCLDGKNGQGIWVHASTAKPSTAAFGDLNKDKVMDVVFVTGSEVIVLEGQKGSILWTWSLPKAAWPTKTDPFFPFRPALTDLTGDKVLDIVVSTSGGHVYAVDGASKGVKYIWDFGITPSRKTGPALCDFNNDKTQDVAVGSTDGTVIILDGKTGHQLNTLDVGDEVVSSPVIGDFTSDGTVDIAVGTRGKKIVAIQTETRIKKNQIVWNAF